MLSNLTRNSTELLILIWLRHLSIKPVFLLLGELKFYDVSQVIVVTCKGLEHVLNDDKQ